MAVYVQNSYPDGGLKDGTSTSFHPALSFCGTMSAGINIRFPLGCSTGTKLTMWAGACGEAWNAACSSIARSPFSLALYALLGMKGGGGDYNSRASLVIIAREKFLGRIQGHKGTRSSSGRPGIEERVNRRSRCVQEPFALKPLGWLRHPGSTPGHPLPAIRRFSTGWRRGPYRAPEVGRRLDVAGTLAH